MFSHEQRYCFVDTTKVDRYHKEIIDPTIFAADTLHNDLVCTLYELLQEMNQNPTISCLRSISSSLPMNALSLRFAEIGDNYTAELQKLHDNTIAELKKACLELAIEIDEDAKYFSAEYRPKGTKGAAQRATETLVFPYNEKARLKRDRELRAEFNLSLSQENLAELEVDPAPPLSETPPNPPLSGENPDQSAEPEPQPSGPKTRPRDQVKTNLMVGAPPEQSAGASARKARRARVKDTHLAGLRPKKASPPQAVVTPTPAVTDGFIDDLATEQEFNAMIKDKVSLSAPEQLDIPDLGKHQYVRNFRKNDKGFFDYVGYRDCHEISRTKDEATGKWIYKKTTKIPTDSIHMSNP